MAHKNFQQSDKMTERELLILKMRFGIDMPNQETWTQEQTNYPREVAEKQMAHSLSDKAEAAYARSELIEKRQAMLESWNSYLEESKAKVLSIRV